MDLSPPDWTESITCVNHDKCSCDDWWSSAGEGITSPRYMSRQSDVISYAVDSVQLHLRPQKTYRSSPCMKAHGPAGRC